MRRQEIREARRTVSALERTEDVSNEAFVLVAVGTHLSYSDPFGLCPYDGKERNTDLSDCPNDERLGAFKLMERNELGRSFINVVAQKGINVSLHDGPMNCSGAKANGCSDPLGNSMVLNRRLGAADLASTVVHETQHFVDYQMQNDAPWINPGSFATDEIFAYAAGFTFLNTLPAQLRAGAIYGPWAAAYARNPLRALRQVCHAGNYTDCP